MDIRTIAAALNGNIVFAVYVADWGAPSAPVAVIEISLALGAALSTYYALRRIPTPAWMARLGKGGSGQAPAGL